MKSTLAAGKVCTWKRKQSGREWSVGGYTIFNLDTHYNLASNWQVFAKVSNLFIKNYSTFLEKNMYTAQNELAVVPSTSRGFRVGLTCQFDDKKSASATND
ncbi:TonB-dependent receptor [Glaciimonas immobilis]|uniref:Outer membrane cobalamin receptor n=1 Tax=Glaciimonas immobilis TaxID=728004 RepID=A0A840RT70_9BURK|nr:TonB-dependent receptor [Glaciimonas immobilis]KAF3996799.1 TonB-dependent receptor [Glaciimonas immobilis]MBB5199659.1 outer membrane cobalamin receptor [Glaciimonas immobilis]